MSGRPPSIDSFGSSWCSRTSATLPVGSIRRRAVALLACIDLPAFPLQLLLQRHPDWADKPAVVVDLDKPQGIILWSNEHARSFRILPGMRYAAGLSLTKELRAGVVEETAIRAGVER